MKKISALFLLFVMTLPLWAQFHDPVKFTVAQNKLSDSEFEIVFTGKIDAGWHVYSTDISDGGPTPATMNFDEQTGVEPVGKLVARGDVHTAFDNMFGMEVSYMENTAVFVQKMRLTAENYTVKGYLNYGACNDENCLPPTNVEFSFAGTGKPAVEKKAVEAKKKVEAVVKAAEKKAETVVGQEAQAVAEVVTEDTAAVVKVAETVGKDMVAVSDYWAPVIDELAAFGEDASNASSGLVEDIPVGPCGRIRGIAHSLCMADYSYDRQLFPETFGR